MSPPCRLPAALLVLLAALSTGGCREAESPSERVHFGSPREEYAHSLHLAGLDRTALGREWLASGDRALRQPHPVALPHREALILPPEEAAAVAFAFTLRRGERLRVGVERDGHWQGQAFVDLLEAPRDTGAAPRRLESADSLAAGLTWVARRDAVYLLRVQPELLRGGRCTITIRTGPSLAFPVVDRDSRAIGSPFGAPRDGGRREHHGIDIFAPRGTPVIAAAEGTVRSVDTTRIGGRVVWLWGREQGLSLYYAHLDSQTVVPGARVRPGDTLGTVGTTGNARGTPPHLHFGVYRRRRGPVDPFPFVHASRAEPPAVQLDPSSLGSWRRTAAGTRLRAAPAGPEAEREISPQTPVRALGAIRDWYRVRLPDGAEGYLPARDTEPALRPIRTIRLASGALVLERPAGSAPAIDSVPAGDILVIGRFGAFAYVQTPAARAGWVLAPE